MPDTPCPRQCDNVAESLCLGFLCSPTPPEESFQRHAFQIQTNHFRVYTCYHLPSQALILGNYTPALLPAGPDVRQLRTAPTIQSPLKLFKVANPQPAFPAFPVPSCGNHDKAFCPQLFSFPLLPDPGASLCGPQCHDMYSLSWDLCV